MRIGNSVLSRLGAALAATFVSACLTALSAQAQVHIVALGDSGIYGKGVGGGENYPDQLQAALRARGHNVVVANQGINGDTTAGVLARLDYAVPAGTDIVVLKVGINDLVIQNKSHAYVDGNIAEIMRRIRAKGAEVININRQMEGKTSGIGDRPELHVEAAPTPGKTAYHFNGAGYAIVVRNTLPAIEAMVKRAEKRRH